MTLKYSKRKYKNNFIIMNYKYLFKFIVIGDPSVGKSCLTL